MRCSSCGTENAPDSRFCGGCGARLDGSRPRLAPTQKIAEDASFPQRAGLPAFAPARAPEPYAPPPSAMPGLLPPRAAPEGSPSGPDAPRATPARAPSESPSFSMPIAARRPWRLITVVLIVDLGLAVAGAWLLTQGLGKPAATRAPPHPGANVRP